MEKKLPVVASKLVFICSKCKKGEMNVTGKALLGNPPKYPHVCSDTKCGHAELLDKAYPNMLFEVIPQIPDKIDNVFKVTP